VVLVEDQPVLYVERGGRGLLTVGQVPTRSGDAGPAGPAGDVLREALQALAEAVRAGRVPRLSLERINGEPAIASSLVEVLTEFGFHSGPRRLTLSA